MRWPPDDPAPCLRGDKLPVRRLPHAEQTAPRCACSSALVRARELRAAGADRVFFVSVDKRDLEPTSHRPKMARHCNEAGLTFVPSFVLPVPPLASGA